MTKDEWIQKAKALMFDCQFSLDSKNLVREVQQLLVEGGGYNYNRESCNTPLIWDLKEREPNEPLY